MKALKKSGFLLLAFSLIWIFPACQGQQAEETTKMPAGDEPVAQAQAIHFSEAQMEMAGVQLGKPEKKMIEQYVECSSTVGVPPESRVMIYSPVRAFVEHVRWIEGEYVKKGQLLTTLTHPDLVKLQREFLEVGSQLDFLKGEYDRKETLAAQDATPVREREQAKANWKMAMARYKGMKAELGMIGIDVARLEEAQEIQSSLAIVSPVSGYLTKVEINPGKLISDQDLLFEILDNSHMHVELAVFSRDLPLIQKGQYIECIEPGSGKVYTADVHLVGKSIDPETRTTNVHGHFDKEPLTLAPGTYLQARIRVFSEEVLTLPRAAVVQEGDAFYVFVQQGGDFVKTLLEAGRITDGLVEVKKLDLPDEASVVVEGAYYLNAAEDQEHSH